VTAGSNKRIVGLVCKALSAVVAGKVYKSLVIKEAEGEIRNLPKHVKKEEHWNLCPRTNNPSRDF